MHPLVRARLEMFDAEYDDPYAEHVVDLVDRTATLLDFICDFEDAKAAERQIQEVVFGAAIEHTTPPGGHMDIENREFVSATSLGRYLRHLHAYAYYGLFVHDDGTMTSVEGYTSFAHLHELFRFTPTEWPGESEIRRLMAATDARFSLDFDEPLEPEGLSLLAGISLKTVRNAMTPSEHVLRLTPEGKVTAESARTWLAQRPLFRNSVWQLASNGEAMDRSPPSQRMSLDAPLFVPRARDGSAFTPDLQRNGQYTIGPKGAEVQLADFHEALDTLIHMPRPCWRRPNDQGNWGIVTGTNWDRRTSAELGLGREAKS